jgi:hypothetical protein
MLLVNTRTSGSFTSASINEIDPRGGASITGENAVGKTTTLELVPLFFGTLPSQITEAVGGREPMLKFVLPMPYSAIVYEYQCGADEAHDVRCAVLRRTDNDHRPVYRFIKGAFRDEAFLRKDELDRQLFCDDKQMVDAYIAMGIECSRQLDIAEYRAVILGTEARTQDAKALRRMSVVYGLGKRLTNLDRLIAAVAKERLDFKDFVRVAITIVQERLNTHGDAPSRQKVTLRQSKDQIDRWLRDRTALEVAFGLAKDVDLLREAIEQHSQAETLLRGVRREVPPALASRKQRLITTQDALKEARSEHGAHLSRTADAVRDLIEKASAADQVRLASQLAVQAEEERRKSLQLSHVQSWASELDQVGQMEVEYQSLVSTEKAVVGKSGDIERRFSDLVTKAETAALKAASEIRAGKDGARSHASVQEETIRSAHAVRLRDLEVEHGAIKDGLDPQIQALVDEKATREAQVAAAQPSQAAMDALKSAGGAVRKAAQRVIDATKAAATAKSQYEQARRDHEDAESAVVRATERVDDADSRLAQAHARMSPPDGSLLSVLRASADDSWKGGIAKIIDPVLLERTDLTPAFNPNADHGTVFGWQLEASSIALPSWADDQQLREALAQCEKTLDAARRRRGDATAAMQKTSDNLQSKKSAKDEADAEASVAKTHHEKALREEEAAIAQCEFEVAELKRNGASLVNELSSRLAEMRAQLKAAGDRLRASRVSAEDGLTEALRRHRDDIQRTIDAIEEQAIKATAQGEASVKRICADRDALLAAEGVDPARLAGLREQKGNLEQRINTAHGHRPTVALWRQWLNEGGEQILVGLKDAAGRAAAADQEARDALRDYKQEANNQEQKIASRVADLESHERTIATEITALQVIIGEHGLRETTTQQADSEQTIEDLRNRLNEAVAKVDECEAQVRRRLGPIRDALTGRASSVADYVQGCLDALPGEVSLVGKAAELCIIYDGLKRQVLPNVINDVTTILNQVRQFRGVITRFENEVAHFNKELQRGLNVAQFHRIESLKVAIVSNFDDLSLMREIDEIDKVAREHETSLAVNDRAQLPDAQTASALTKFLQLLRQDSTVELDLAAHVDLKGSVTVNGQTRHFSRPADLEHISSTGINAIILISLLVGMLNMIRGENDIYIPWISDEVGKFDPGNFKGLMDTLRENRIDPVTASPTLTHAEFRHFARRYVFKDRGSIGIFAPQSRSAKPAHVEPLLRGADTTSGTAHEA